MISTKDFYNAMLERQLDFFAGVPDSLLTNLCACIQENSPPQRSVIAANEGNAIGMACGYHLSTGKYGVVYMQNSGQGNAVNPLLSLADSDVYGIPMLLIIGWRGEPGVHDEPQHVKQGKVTLSLLETMGIPYRILDDDYERTLDVSLADMRRESKPVAIVVRKGTFDKYGAHMSESRYPLTREQALCCILDSLRPSDMVVSTTGKTSRELFELRVARGEDHSRDFLTVGGMGHTASIAFGMAVGTDKNVYCIDGDGSFIMHMGGLGPIVQHAPVNFKYILNNNGAHESVGGQPTAGFSIDIEKILYGLGFETVYVAKTEEEIRTGMRALASAGKAALLLYTRQGSRENLGRPTVSPKENKKSIMASLMNENSKSGRAEDKR